MRDLIVGYMAAWNEAEFIRPAIQSTIQHVDLMVVIEGAFKETVETGGELRSNDGTLDILNELAEQFPEKLSIISPNAPISQLEHRSLVFEYVNWRFKGSPPDYWLWIIDADEVYDDENAEKLKSILRTTDSYCIKVDSITFVNDFAHWVKIAFPRCFKIRKGFRHYFSSANDVVAVRDNKHLVLNQTEVNHEDDVRFWHYSYCKDPERFTQKKKERTRVHGSFKWYLDEDGKVTADGINLRKYDGEHPPAMRHHTRMT